MLFSIPATSNNKGNVGYIVHICTPSGQIITNLLPQRHCKWLLPKEKLSPNDLFSGWWMIPESAWAKGFSKTRSWDNTSTHLHILHLHIISHLMSADLTSSDLTSAYLTSTHLTSSHLMSADLTSSDLTFAYLTSSHLTSSHLVSADLTSSHLPYSDLTSSHLTSADLTSSDLTSSDLTSADLALSLLTLSLSLAHRIAYYAWEPACGPVPPQHNHTF